MRDFYKEARELHEKEKYEEAIELYKQGMEAGDEKCWCGYAILLKEGNGISADSEFAMSILREHFDAILALAKRGDASAQFNLALMYENGEGVEQNYEEAVKWYTLAAEQGDIDAQFNLGVMYATGEGVEQNYEETVKWFAKVAEQGRFHAPDKEAIKQYTLAAEQGDVSAQNNLASMYENGEGVEQNYEEAVKWYTLAAEQGYIDAQFNLALMYENGKGVEQNYEEAVKWYTLVAEQGEELAQFSLGFMYFIGQGVEQNYEEAAKWYTLAAEQGNSCAQNNIGCLYEEGKGVEQSYERARYWYEKAAAEGNGYALTNLGILYEQGLGVDILPSKAVELWKKACKADPKHSEGAQYKLGYAYYDGFGVEQNLEKAKEYFELAFKNGYNCSYAIDMVKYELSNREINKKSAQENGDNEIRKYAEKIIKKKNFYINLPLTISRDLEKDFGDTWKKLHSDTQKSLVTAMHDYVMHYPSKALLEFNSTINGICRALEIELGKVIYTSYIRYLISQNIDPNSFPKNRSFLKQVSKSVYAYHNPQDVSKFTLGSIKLVVGLDKEMMFEAQLLDRNEKQRQAKYKNKIDKTMVDYMRYICKEGAFGNIEKDRAITDYLIYFTQEIGAIADSLRNPAAHANIIKCEKAEVCGNYIIKVKKILKHFLEKIDFDKLNEL